MTMRETRRNVLKAGAGLATTGALAGLAGCSQVPVVGDVFGGGGAFYQNDLYAPGTVTDRDHYRFSAIRPSQIDENEDEFDDDNFSSIEQFVETMYESHDIDFDEIDTWTSIDAGGVTVITGQYTPDDVVSELEDNDFEEETETDSGYRILLNGSQRTCTAVAGESIVTMHSANALGGQGQGQGQSADQSGDQMGTVNRQVQDLRSMSYGETVRSQLDESDPQGFRGFYEPVTFDGTQGNEVTIRMVSRGDTYLMLQDPSGTVVAENDDHNSLNSQIGPRTLQSSGEYTIVATSFSDGATFTYDLRLTRAFNPEDMVDPVESIVGVKSGETERYVDEVTAASDLVGAIGGGTMVNGWTSEPVEVDEPASGQIEDAVAMGYAVQVNGSEANLTAAAVFDDQNDVDAGDVEDWVDEHGTLSEADDLSESEQGRAGIVTGVIDTDDL